MNKKRIILKLLPKQKHKIMLHLFKFQLLLIIIIEYMNFAIYLGILQIPILF